MQFIQKQRPSTNIFIRLFTLLLLTNVAFHSYAQLAPVQQFTEEAGLPGNSVRDIVKDAQGNLWIGTDNGLSKYDGTSFTNYYKNDGLPGNRVWALASTPDSSIYVGCYLNGLRLIKEDSIYQVPGFPSTQKLKSIRQLSYSQYLNALLIGTDHGLYSFRNKKITRLDTLISHPSKVSITGIREEGPILYYSVHASKAAGLYRLHINATSLAPIQHTRVTSRKSFESEHIDSVIYNSYFNQLTLLDKKTLAPFDTLHADKEMLIWDMAKDDKKNLWLAGFGHNYNKGSLNIVNTSKKTIAPAPYQVFTNSLSCLFFDKETQIMWAGSSDNGLFAIQKTPFSTLQSDKIKGILDIAPIGTDSIYTLTKAGLFLWNGKIFKEIYSKAELKQNTLTLRDKNYPQKAPATSWARFVWHTHSFQLSHIAKLDNRLYVASNRGSISIEKTPQYLPLGYDSYIKNSGDVFYAIPYTPLVRIPSLKDAQHSEIVKTASAKVSDISKMIMHKGQIFAASYFNGLYAIKNNQAQNLNSKNSQLGDNITDLTIGPDNYLWCVSNEGHLFQLDIADSLKVKNVWSSKNNLQGNQFKWLTFSGEHLFLGSNKGVNVVPLSELGKKNFRTVHFYNAHNNYSHISANNAQKDDADNIYLHTFDKIISITNSYQPPTSDGKLIIKGIKINNQAATLAQLESQKLKHYQQSMGLSFLLQKYPNSYNTSYRYRINSGHWQNSNTLHLQQLLPGNYQLELEAFDLETSSTYRKKLSFAIAPPWYRHPLGILFIITTLGLLVFTIFQYRLRRERKQQQARQRIAQEMAALQIRSLQGQMNPHFIFNSLNSIQNQMLSNKTETALDFLNKLAGLMRTNLNHLGHEFISLEQEIDFIVNYLALEKMRFKDKLDYTLDVKTHDLSFLIPPMMLQPIIENSIKHGIRPLTTKGHISIVISDADETLHVEIKDNGIGRKAAAKNKNPLSNTGKGLKLIKRRLELLNKQYETDSFDMQIKDLPYRNVSDSGTCSYLTFLKMRKQ